MSRLTDIETALNELLNEIDQQTIGDYTYHTKTGTVQVYDANLSDDKNEESGEGYTAVNHIIQESDSVPLTLLDESIGQDAYGFNLVYKITSKLNLDGSSSSQADAKNKMRLLQNNLFDDFLFLFGGKAGNDGYTLKNTVSQIWFNSMERGFNQANSLMQGSLVTYWIVKFSSSASNPGTNACDF